MTGSKKRAAAALGLAWAVLACQAVVWARETAAPAASKWAKKPAFDLRVGSFFSDLSGQIRIDTTDGRGTTIDLAEILHLPTTALVLRGRGDFRLAKWFGIEAEYYRISRSKTTPLDRTITVGDVVFEIDQDLTSRLTQNYLDLSFKFYLLHRSRFDLGLWLGANTHFFALTMSAEPSGRAAARKVWYPVPALGICGDVTVMPRMYLYGKAGYFYYGVDDASLNLDAFRADITLDYYFWKSVGVGVTYEYVQNIVEKVGAKFIGMIKNRTSGVQIYAVIGF